MSRVIKVGVIGCGQIAQWMHLPFLTELPGFEVTALCDISPLVLDHVGERFRVEHRFTDVDALLEWGDVDAVVIATPLHAEPTIAASRAGKHVLVEKPMALTLHEAEAMVDAAERAGVVLMLGYMKRYDPGYQYGRRLMQQMTDLRLIRVHDLAGPNPRFIQDVTTTFRDPADQQTRLALLAEMQRRAELALGAGHPDAIYTAFHLLGGLSSHDISIMRGAFGTPHAVCHTEIWQNGSYILSVLDYGDGCRAVFEIGTTRKKEFDEELSAFGLHQTVRILFPSPYIKYAPTIVETTEEEDGALVERTITASYEEAFRRELSHFHRCITEGQTPVTSGRDSIEDVRLQIEMIKAALR